MRGVKSKLFLIFILLFVVGSFGIVSATWIDCYQYGPYGSSGGTVAACIGAGCVATSSSGTVIAAYLGGGASNDNVSIDLWCGSDMPYCCLNKECWQWDGTDETTCETNDGTLTCIWNGFPATMYFSNGTAYTVNGTCMTDWNSMGEDNWGGTQDSCWQNDGNKQQCLSNQQSCQWRANDANQNPWCWIKTLGDAQTQNSLATSLDIGCCETKGCWSYDGNQTLCENNTAFGWACTWHTKEQDPYCPDDTGCCYTKSCSEAGSNETICNMLKQQMMMPCNFTDSQCQDLGGGGFDFYDSDMDSCMLQGGWYDINGDCILPNMTDDGGAYMFGGEAHCWFADNQQNVCNNITGCAYCQSGSGNYGVDNCTDGNSDGSPDNICCNKLSGYCEGHDAWDVDKYANANNSNNLNCTHIQIKSACQYGPLPQCKWSNSSAVTGPYCERGTSSETKTAPPVPFCEHPDAKNNQTLCNKLANEYMMPCKWQSSYVNINGVMQVNCTFNPNAVFGVNSTEKEFEVISSEYSCIAAGGTWHTEYYMDGTVLKQDSWCEKGALYDPLAGQAAGNKGNCNTDCWACEFRYNGTKWGTNLQAESECVGSTLGYCQWTNDTSAPNGQGYCDYPSQMNYGSGDCNVNCKDCDLMSTTQLKYDSCTNSQANCKWVNNTNSTGSFLTTGYCVDKNKKTCNDDCFSCYGENDCFASTLDCTWDSTNKLCKPNSFSGEVCFDAVDNDNDGYTDCSDPDCSFDNSCGGNNFADCGSITNISTCGNTSAFGSLNCTWYNFTWEITGHCGMPGENCWQFDGNYTGCMATTGCTAGNESDQTFGGNGFCQVNQTLMEGAQCWQYSDEENCAGDGNCGWVNDSWCESNPTDSWCDSIGGWCDMQIFANCSTLSDDEDSCVATPNCMWREDEWMDQGFCDIACFNNSLTSGTCGDGDRAGFCEWVTQDTMCMPSTFDSMASASGGKTGCPKYDGNFSACALNNYTCVWLNDSSGSLDNDVSGGGGIDGWCNDKGMYEIVGDMKGEMYFLGPDATGDGINGYDWADIKGFGMRVSDKAYGFGVGIYNITNGSVCNGYDLSLPEAGVTSGVGSGLNITKMRWYLDTDGSSGSQTHCYATDSHGASCTGADTSLCDYEFYIDYIVKNNTNTGNIQTTKKLYTCAQNGSSVWQWVPTNVFVTDDKKFTCFSSGMGAVFVSVEKEALENFDLFDITEPMKIFVVSYSGQGSSSYEDEVGPSYYTPGTIDFGFIDCSDPNTKNSKCKNFQKFGTQIFEDCKNEVDDDNDGYTDCDDPKCVFSPACVTGTAFNWTSQCSGDYKTPIITFTDIDKMADSAIIKYDTDEPANGSLIFYNRSSTCSGTPTYVNDLGDVTFTYDDYKPFHRGVLDSTSLISDLINNTAYYYKLRICDPCGNCGTSACLNFTTKKKNKPFIFRMDLPANYSVNITASDGTEVYSGNFTTTIAGTTYDVGVKTNTSVSKNMNVSVYNGDLELKFIGVDLYKPKVLNFENAFIADTDNEILGMNSTTKSWNFVLNDMGMGGANDSIELNFPVTYNAGNSLNWADDGGNNASNVTDYTTCYADGTGTACKVPVSLGFSKYYLVSASEDDDGTPTTSSPGGGGGGGGSSSGNPTYTITESQLAGGYSREIAVNSRFKFTIEEGEHYLTLDEVTENTASINVSSTPQFATLSVGDSRRFDVTDDIFYDLKVTLNSVNATTLKANFSLIKINESITASTIAEEQEKESGAEQQRKEDLGGRILWWIWIIVGVVVIILVYLIFVRKKK